MLTLEVLVNLVAQSNITRLGKQVKSNRLGGSILFPHYDYPHALYGAYQ
jgi:hypothetical protein